jgi:hypothetical protein
MEISQKIMLLGLPPALEGALAQQLGHIGVLTRNREEALLFICGQASAEETFPPAVPVLPLRTDRPLRLGTLLRQARQMLEEPALYLGPFPLGPYEFSPQEKMLSQEGGTDIPLTDKEVDILVYLSRAAPEPVAREELLRNVWRYQTGVDTHTLETHIYRLRQKMGEDAENPRLLLTDARGYRLAA